MLSARRKAIAVLAGIGLVLFGVDQVGAATPNAPEAALTATIVNYSDWGTGFSDGATVTNTTAGTITGWNIQFDLDPSEALNYSSGATHTSSGNRYTLTATGAAATLTAGAHVLIHFKGTESAGHYIAPTNVTATPGTGGGTTGPATPTTLTVTGTTTSSISLFWTETNNSDPATSYRVRESTTLVASPTAPNATITGLLPATTHTYVVEALDAKGVASPPSAPITATTQSTGGASGQFSQSLIDSAVAAPLFAWAAPTSGTPRPGTSPSNIAEAKVVYYLAVVDKAAPGSKATNGTSVRSRLLAQVRSMIAGGHEPDADGGLEMWGQAPVAQALLLLKNNGPAWSQLSAGEKNKVTLLEAAMGYGSNYTYNDADNFPSGICGFGNFAKTNNPNYRDGGVDAELAAIQFFGASTWDRMLSSFNDATFTSQLDAAGLTNAGQCFAAVGSGGNPAIAIPFVYAGHHSNDLMGIWGAIAAFTFDKTAVSVVSPAHIADNTKSPYDGQCCMGHEFNSTDSSGLRSSALYVFEGWMNVTGARVAMELLGTFNAGNSAEAQFHIGTLDMKDKLDHGYIGQALNQDLLLVDDHGNPAADGPNAKGFQYDWDAYSVSGAPQS